MTLIDGTHSRTTAGNYSGQAVSQITRNYFLTEYPAKSKMASENYLWLKQVIQIKSFITIQFQV